MCAFGIFLFVCVASDPECSIWFIGSDVTVNSVHPGSVCSDLVRHSTVMSLLFALFSLLLKTPREGAQTSVYCAVAEELHLISGKHFRWEAGGASALRQLSEELRQIARSTSFKYSTSDLSKGGGRHFFRAVVYGKVI